MGSNNTFETTPPVPPFSIEGKKPGEMDYAPMWGPGDKPGLDLWISTIKEFQAASPKGASIGEGVQYRIMDSAGKVVAEGGIEALSVPA